MNTTSQLGASGSIAIQFMAEEPSRETFEIWIDAIARGDSSAFGQFYDTYTVRLYRLTLILSHGNEELAKEVHQTAMIKAARHFRRFEKESEIWPWLCQIARNAYVDHLRKESLFSRLRSLLRIESETREHEGVDEESQYECLERAVAQLEAEDLALLNSAYQEKKTQSEIALDLAKTPKAVERRLSRIRQKLRVLLLKELEHE